MSTKLRDVVRWSAGLLRADPPITEVDSAAFTEWVRASAEEMAINNPIRFYKRWTTKDIAAQLTLRALHHFTGREFEATEILRRIALQHPYTKTSSRDAVVIKNFVAATRERRPAHAIIIELANQMGDPMNNPAIIGLALKFAAHVDLSSRHTASVAAGCIYLAASQLGYSTTLDDLAKASGKSSMAIRKAKDDIQNLVQERKRKENNEIK